MPTAELSPGWAPNASRGDCRCVGMTAVGNTPEEADELYRRAEGALNEEARLDPLWPQADGPAYRRGVALSSRRRLR